MSSLMSHQRPLHQQVRLHTYSGLGGYLIPILFLVWRTSDLVLCPDNADISQTIFHWAEHLSHLPEVYWYVISLYFFVFMYVNFYLLLNCEVIAGHNEMHRHRPKTND